MWTLVLLMVNSQSPLLAPRLNCSAGKYVDNSNCVVCPRGKYSSQPNSASCNECPGTLTTALSSSVSSKNCSVRLPPAVSVTAGSYVTVHIPGKAAPFVSPPPVNLTAHPDYNQYQQQKLQKLTARLVADGGTNCAGQGECYDVPNMLLKTVNRTCLSAAEIAQCEALAGNLSCVKCAVPTIESVSTTNFVLDSPPQPIEQYTCADNTVTCRPISVSLPARPQNETAPVNFSVTSSSGLVSVHVQSDESPLPSVHTTSLFTVTLLAMNNNGSSAAVSNISVAYMEPVYRQWTSWSLCSASCGPGVEKRTRAAVFPAVVDIKESRPCNLKACPPLCDFTAWSAWSPCSATCSAFGMPPPRSVRTRTTSSTHPSCIAQVNAFKLCNVDDCPQDCVHSPMRAVPCNVECGGGEMHYLYYVQLKNSPGGSPCPENKTSPCNTVPCKTIVHTDKYYADRGMWVVAVSLFLMIAHSLFSISRS